MFAMLQNMKLWMILEKNYMKEDELLLENVEVNFMTRFHLFLSFAFLQFKAAKVKYSLSI